jgi:hypothetical protein
MNRTSAVIILIGVIGALACGGAVEEPEPESASRPLLEVRQAYSEASGERTRFEFDSEVLYVAPTPVLSDSDLQDVRAEFGRDPAGRDVLLLHLQCAPDADERMKGVAAEHLNERLAVFFNGDLRAVPILRSEAGCSSLTVAIPATELESMQLIDRIQDQWPAGT